MRISMVAAMGRNREIGRNNKLLWHLPEDLIRFKKLTLGHPVIMGRKTYESILDLTGKPLPNRSSIVITGNEEWWHKGAWPVPSPEAALTLAPLIKGGDKEAFVIGGAQIYELLLPYTERLYLTLVEDKKDADAYFPAYENEFTRVVEEEKDGTTNLSFRFVTVER